MTPQSRMFNRVIQYFKHRKVKRGVNTVIHPNANIFAPQNTVLGDNVQLEYGAIIKCFKPGSEEKIIIHNNVRIQEYALIHSLKGFIEIGDYSYIGPYSVIYGHCRDGKGGTKIGRYVLMSGHCFVIPANHIFTETSKPIYKQNFISKGIIIEDDVWIGANCTILDGVTIGQGAIVAAGSVVTNNVPRYSMVAGVPAVVKKMRESNFSDKGNITKKLSQDK